MENRIRVLVVDDEPLARRGIRQLLESETDFEIVGEAANGREAVSAIEKLAPELVFLDIQMPLLDGFSFIEKVGAGLLPEIVFVTAYDEHAITAFEINALDYLLKPINPERFQKTLNRVREQIKNGRTKEIDHRLSALLQSLESAKLNPEQTVYLDRIAVKDAGRITLVDVNEIDWISSEGNYVQLHAKGKTHLLRETMDGIERKLNPQKFLRLRRSTIVRVEEIKELTPLFNGEVELVLKNGTKLSSSRRYRKNLETILKF
ncbi:MAG: LytTR family transcriptional regulator DNA-binding domain-containing protein [Acidobacteria bacterium]|jgi:two-component system LytT family response regulator|nr:LytTR family transcriptional regulator DNA-binding domain-containing protein [Acidobacteriota bacterium]